MNCSPSCRKRIRNDVISIIALALEQMASHEGLRPVPSQCIQQFLKIRRRIYGND